MKHMQKDEFEFGLTIPQGWRGGDLPLEEENNPVKQYEFSKLISVTADSIGFDSIYAYDHLVPFYSGDRNKNIFECFILLSGLAAIILLSGLAWRELDISWSKESLSQHPWALTVKGQD